MENNPAEPAEPNLEGTAGGQNPDEPYNIYLVDNRHYSNEDIDDEFINRYSRTAPTLEAAKQIAAEMAQSSPKVLIAIENDSDECLLTNKAFLPEFKVLSRLNPALLAETTTIG